MTKMMFAISAVVAAIVIVMASLWAGIAGVILVHFTIAASAVLFAARPGTRIITNLPGPARTALEAVKWWSIVLIVGVGAFDQLQKAEKKHDQERAAKRAATLDLSRVNYVHPGQGKIMAGKNVIALTPAGWRGDGLDCIAAPAGWYFSGRHDQKYHREVLVGGKKVPTLEVRVDCGPGNPGWLSRAHSEYRPRSISVRNHGAQAASMELFMLPDSWVSR